MCIRDSLLGSGVRAHIAQGGCRNAVITGITSATYVAFPWAWFSDAYRVASRRQVAKRSPGRQHAAVATGRQRSPAGRQYTITYASHDWRPAVASDRQVG
eukprot:6506740-Prymnesium_polylepis.1